MTEFYALFVDGTCLKVKAETKPEALDMFFELLNYDDISDFFDDLNLVEWKSQEFRFIYDYPNKNTLKFPSNTPYQLESYLKSKIKKSKKPSRQMAEEFDDIIE